MGTRRGQLAPPLALATLALAATLVAYLPALEAGFYFDDLPNLVEAPSLHWDSLSLDNLRALSGSGVNSRRVVANFSFALNYLAGGLDPAGYHRVNLLVHLAAGLALAWVAVLLIREPPGPRGGAGGSLTAATAAAALFLVHPLATQAVTYVVQRMTSLATLFSLLCLGAYVRGRQVEGARDRVRWLAAAGVAGLLALGSKETALLLPLVIVTWETCFRREHWRRRLAALASASRRRQLGALAVILATGLLAVAVVGVFASGSRLSWSHPFPGRDFNGLERMLTQFRVQVFYLGLVLWPAPSRLNLDHELTVSRGLLAPATTLPALIFWLAVAVGAVWLAARRPRWGFPLLMYLELHLLESGPLNLELVFEHRMYAPLAALALLLAVVLADLPVRGRRVGMVAAVLLILPLAGATRQRNLTWADPIAFHYDCAEKSPGKFRPHFNLGTVLGQAGRVREAIPPLERAVALEPEHSQAHNQLANALLMTGRREQALGHYRRAVDLDPGNAEAVYNLAAVLDQSGEHGEARAYYRRFLELDPPHLAARVARVRQRLVELGGGGSRPAS